MQTTSEFTVRRATPQDLPFVMEVERLPGMSRFIGAWDEDRHRLALADKGFGYFIALSGTTPAAFAIVRGWADPDRVTFLQRLAAAVPGTGAGSRLLASVTDSVFMETDAYRFWLGTYPENTRARSVYRSLGFTEEGILRANDMGHGEPRDELAMSILRPEWQARRQASA